MLKPKFGRMNFPRGLGLHILKGYLNDDQMEKIIAEYSALPRKQRRIILPSRSCVRKVYLHFLFRNIKEGKATWKETRKSLQKRFGSLANAKADLDEVKHNYFQREKEILRGQ